MDSCMDEFNLAVNKAYDIGDIDEFMRLLDGAQEDNSSSNKPVHMTTTESQSNSFADYCAPKRPGYGNRNSRRKRGTAAPRPNGFNRRVDPGPSRLHASAAEFVPSYSHGNLTTAIENVPKLIHSLQSLEINDVQQPVTTPASTLAAHVQAEVAAAGLDAEGAMMYEEAMNAFDSAFPALGGRMTAAPTPQPTMPGQSTSQDSRSFLEKMRLDSLKAQFEWVDISIIEQAFDTANGSTLGAEAILNLHFPKPPDWDVMIVATRAKSAPVRYLVEESIGNSTPNSAGVRRTKDVGGHWVATGAAVSALYETLRGKAGEEARMRNALFDRAKAAVDRGDRNEARRLGALGREANVRMKKLHDQAADAIFEARNPNGCHGQIDLHGLHVTEAIERLAYALEIATGDSLRVLTGSGHHTKGTGKARLRPAVKNWLQNNGYRYQEIADSNAHVGAFLVKL